MFSCLRSRKGVATAEWVIVMPLFIFFLLAIGQIGFMINAKQTVTYAAYMTARSFLAFGAGTSTVIEEEKGKKAAALACMGITGLANLNPYPVTTDPDIIRMAGRYSRDSRSHADFLQRYTAALDKTRVKIYTMGGPNGYPQVKVEVLHDYELDFPLVNYFISGLFSNHSKYGYPHIPIRSTVVLG